MKEKTILFGGDHAGFECKELLMSYAKELGYTVEDLGPKKCKEDDDYPDFVHSVAQRISEAPEKYAGVVIGGSGQGEAIVANRYKGVRAAVYYGFAEEILALSREHNDANVLSLGARFLSAHQAKEALGEWLKTEFSEEERHVRRIKKIDES